MPVYIGNVDTLLNPFLDGLSDEEVKNKFKLFLNYIDRTIADGYCHANLGPTDLRATRLFWSVNRNFKMQFLILP